MGSYFGRDVEYIMNENKILDFFNYMTTNALNRPFLFSISMKIMLHQLYFQMIEM